jgi:2-oxoisovalerate dehydrogenase E1 component
MSAASPLVSDQALSSQFASLKPHFLKALKIRLVETQLLKLFAEGELNGTVHTCVGQELTPVFVAHFLEDQDVILSNHRGHGHFLARFDNVAAMIGELMGRVQGASSGYGGSQHFYGRHFYSNGIQGGMTPIAAGLADAYAHPLDGAATVQRLVVDFIGDGTLGEGQFYESLNLVSKWSLPVLYVIEDNAIAQSTDQRQTLAGSMKGRADAFDIAFFSGDAHDPAGLFEAVRAAAGYVRSSGKPTILHAKVYRLNSHSKGDDNRLDEHIASLRAQDILQRLQDLGHITPAEVQAYTDEIETIVAALKPQAKLVAVPRFEPWFHEKVVFHGLNLGSSDIYAKQIATALHTILHHDPDAMIVGEDIEDGTEYAPKPYGGAFKCTKGLSGAFKGRVRNTPISEGAIVGFATGRALAGKKTIAEIMFGDFTTLIVDQIHQHAAKFPTMFGQPLSLPMMVRTPMGGRRGYGPTHSQSIERLFFGVQNLLVLALHHRLDPTSLYKAAFDAHSGPTFMIENKILYTLSGQEPLPEGYVCEISAEPFPTVRLMPRQGEASCTLLTYGHGLHLAEQAARQLMMSEEIGVEIIAPSALTPSNLWPLADSVARTGRLVTLEEGATFGGYGGEAAAALLAMGVAPKTLRRLGNNTIIPTALDAELDLLPSVQDVVRAVLDVTEDV